jgi:hypothetical protein
VLEIIPARAVIVSCMDEPHVLDGMPDHAGAFKARIAPDELWLVGPAGAAAEVMAHANGYLSGAGSFGLAMDVTDGWSVLTVKGDGTMQVWARFSENQIPAERPAFVQGAVAAVATRAIVFDAVIHFMCPAPLRHHLPQRILRGCADLSPRLLDAAEFVLTPGTTEAGGR